MGMPSYKIGLYSTYFRTDKESDTYTHKSLTNALADMGHKHRVMVPAKFSFHVSSNTTRVLYDSKELDIDGLIIRGTHGARIPTSLLTNCLWYQNIPTIDRRQAFSGQYMTKFGALLRRYCELRDYVPGTFLMYSRESACSHYKTGAFDRPMIRKPIQGTRGVGVKVIRTRAEIKDFIENYDFSEPLMLQEYIENTREFRSILVGDKCLGIVKKIPNPEGLGNFAQGAQFIRADKEYEEIIRNISLNIGAKSPYDILGIDILLDKNSRIYIIEANRNPQYRGFELACPGIDVGKHIVELMIQRIIKSGRKPAG